MWMLKIPRVGGGMQLFGSYSLLSALFHVALFSWPAWLPLILLSRKYSLELETDYFKQAETGGEDGMGISGGSVGCWMLVQRCQLSVRVKKDYVAKDCGG